MATSSNIHLHLYTTGDVIVDQITNTVPNNTSPAIVYKQAIPPNVSTAIYNPFNQLSLGPVYLINNVLIVPDILNTSHWTLSTLTTPPDLHFHPTNPMLLSLTSLGTNLYIHHTNGTPVIFQFYWV